MAKLEVMLASDDGAAFPISGLEPVRVPVGRYSVGMVSLALRDPRSAKPLCFVFSKAGDTKDRWHAVGKDSDISIDPIGKLRLNLEVEDKGFSPGQPIRISTLLHTADGLLINSSSFGAARIVHPVLTSITALPLRSLDWTALLSVRLKRDSPAAHSVRPPSAFPRTSRPAT